MTTPEAETAQEAAAAAAAAESTMPRSRSVNDFGTTEELFRALTTPPATAPASPTPISPLEDLPLRDDWDWVLTNYDVGTTEPQSIREELLRLQVLKSYLMLDKEREASFDRLTSLASRQFNVAIAVVSLVDLGRQWFMSTQGLGDVRETPRSLAFCAHAIQGRNDIFIVRDTHQDGRFCNNALVTGAPFIRFYAGAPLLSPEGYKLGTFCIIDDKPRPNGMTESEQALLIDLAAITVQTMVDRRAIASQHDMSQLVACTAHDLLTPLMGVQLSLSLLQDDHDFQRHLSAAQQETFAHGLRSAEWLHRICQNTMNTLRRQATTSPYALGGVAAAANNNNMGDDRGDTMSVGSIYSGPDGFGMPHLIPQTVVAAAATENGVDPPDDTNPFIDMTAFLQTLNATVEPIPKRVPLIVKVEDSVPNKIISDELKLFRSSLNLLSSAFSRTEIGFVQFRIFVQQAASTQNSHKEEASTRELSQLVFECLDTGKDCRKIMGLSSDDNGGDNRTHANIFKPQGVGAVPNLALSSVAYQIESLGGRYGYRPRRGVTGSTFWFSVPLVLPKDLSGLMFSHSVVTPAKKPKQKPHVSRASTFSSADIASGVRRRKSSPGSEHRTSLPESLLKQTISAGMDGSIPAPSISPTRPKSPRVSRNNRSYMNAAMRQSGILAVTAAAAAAAPASACARCVSPKRSPSWQDFRRTMSSPSGQYCWKDRKVLLSNKLKSSTSTGSMTDIDPHSFSSSLPNGLSALVDAMQLSSVQPPAAAGLFTGSTQSANWPRAPSSLDTNDTMPVPNKNVAKFTPILSTETKTTEQRVRGKKALVIEDTLVVRKTLTRALQRNGYEVTQANDGLEGLDELKKTVFDFVLCDFLMPNMDGLDCVQQYRQWEEANRSSEPPQYIVGISAHVSEKDVNRGLEVGMNAFQPKPITLAYLKELDESEALKSRRNMLAKHFDIIEVFSSTVQFNPGQNESVTDVTNIHSVASAHPITNGFSAFGSNHSAGSSNEASTAHKHNHPQNGDNTSPTDIRQLANPRGSPVTGTKACLMATAELTNASSQTVAQMQNAGWAVTLVNDGDRALENLKIRNWDAVILCDELPGLGGHQCVGQFRDWERENRVNRQENVILVCTQISLPLGLETVMHPPAGFDGALDCHMEWGSLESLLSRNRNSHECVNGGMRIVIR